MIPFLFYFFSGSSILFAAGVLFSPRPVYALLSFILTLFSISALYILLGAPFLAMTHLIVYAGAVLVLFLFVIMVQGVGAKDIPLLGRFNGMHLLLSAGVCALIFGLLFYQIFRLDLGRPLGVDGSIEKVGYLLFRSYSLPFFLTSLFLLLGVFAASALAKEEKA